MQEQLVVRPGWFRAVWHEWCFTASERRQWRGAAIWAPSPPTLLPPRSFGV